MKDQETLEGRASITSDWYFRKGKLDAFQKSLTENQS
jgi:hypothetical protein